jgi:ATP-dependent DNA helicase RecG
VECHDLEIKSWCNGEKDLAEKVSEAAACIANAQGGILLVGIGQNQSCRHRFSACPYPSVSPSWLTARIHDHTVPPVVNHAFDISSIASEVIGSTDVHVFVLEVPRTNYVSGHMTLPGLSKIRVGKECVPYYTAEDDRTRIPAPGVSIGDLSVESIRWAIAEHRRKFDVQEGRWVDPQEFLAQGRLVERYLVDGEALPHYHIPLSALILFGKQAALSAHLPFLETIVITDGGEIRLHKNVVDCVQALCASQASRIPSQCPTIARSCIQELLINAYIHRCYRTPAPIVVRITASALEISNPGELLGGLHPDNLIHCVPVYRNLSLADGARFIGLCDKIGRGIDTVYESALSGGFDIPVFESGNNLFTGKVPLQRSIEFREFVRKRAQSLSNLDEILVLRFLWSRHEASLMEISWVLQRSHAATRRILEGQMKKYQVERSDHDLSFHLTASVRRDIETIFQSDQMDMNLWGE